MTTPRVDDETLAAFLDARLSAAERARVLQAIADEPKLYEHFFEAAHLIAEEAATEESPGERGDVPDDAPRTWRRRLLVAVPLLAAAAIAGVMVQRSRADSSDVVALMEGVRLASVSGPGSVQRALGDNWDQPGWSVVRGAESSSASAGTVARLGARMTQLAFSARAADTVAYAVSAARARALLTTIAGSGPLAATLAALPITASADRATLARRIREVSGEPTAFDVGGWLETARLSYLNGADDFAASGSAAAATLHRITDALGRAPPDSRWEDIERHLRAIEENSANPSLARAHVDSALKAIPR